MNKMLFRPAFLGVVLAGCGMGQVLGGGTGDDSNRPPIQLFDAGTLPMGDGATPPSSADAATGSPDGGSTPDPDGGAMADGGTHPTDPYNTPVTCTSGVYATARKGWTMRPGEQCVACHTSQGEGPRFSVAGTVYPSAHEPDSCNGVNGPSLSDLVVEITDANGAVYRPAVQSSGNFGVQSSSFTPPYSVRLTYQGRTRAMLTRPTSADCNSCHTQDGGGTPMAPGRIMLP